jgi:hypothetical protein
MGSLRWKMPREQSISCLAWTLHLHHHQDLVEADQLNNSRSFPSHMPDGRLQPVNHRRGENAFRDPEGRYA